MQSLSMLLAAGLVLLCAGHASAFIPCDSNRQKDCFMGQLVLDDIPGDLENKKLRYDFAYIDPAAVGWETSAGDITNGASIPKLLRPIVGGAFDREFIAAAVIHDHYCDDENQHRVRDWRETHRVFYHALLNQQVEPLKAKLMYYAVYTFGPRWGYLHSPKDCNLIKGSACIKSTVGSYQMSRRDAGYESEGAEQELKLVEAVLEASNGELSLAELEQMSDTMHEEDRFLHSLLREPKEGTGPVYSR